MSESQQQQPKYLGVFFVVTAGQNGSQLGSDEEEIVLLVLSILNTSTNKVIITSNFVVQPRTSDINENLLSEECKVDFKLNDDMVKNAIPLETAIEELDEIVRENTGDEEFTLVVDGQLPLRQTLHPEACAKEITLPGYYDSFFDLRKEFAKRYEVKPEEISEMTQHLELSIEDEPSEIPVGKIKEMTAIVQRMLKDSHIFAGPEVINMKLEPGICSKFEEVDSNTVVRARGLPWQSSDVDIAKFFRGLNIAKGGVALCLSLQGRRNGEALVRFQDQEHRDMALKRHKHHIATRYIEVYKASGEDFINVAGGSNNEAQAFLSKGGQVIVRMRGLPYDCTAKQVLEFFNSGESPCQTLDGEEGVLFVRRPDGRATGDAFVLFSVEEDASKALSKHRESIGSRYIELFRSTTAEVQQVLNRSMEPKAAEIPPQLPLVTPVAAPPVAPQVAVPILPQHIITSGTRRDCIRLRGLPYEAQVEHILEFLNEHAKSIVYQGVHMVYNAQGQPSGEAFIQMDSEQSAYLAAQAKHHRYMMHFKKQRYIEVFQCSGDDMNLVLTGGSPPQNLVLTAGLPSPSQQKALVSPGMLSPSGGASIMPMNVHPHPLSPLSPHQQHQQLIRSNPMAAAIAAASMRPAFHGPPNPGLLSFLSPHPMNPSSMGPPGHPGGFGHHHNQPGSLLGSPPCASQGLMGSPPALLQPNSPVAASFTHGGSSLPSPTPEDVLVQMGHRAHLLNSHHHHHLFPSLHHMTPSSQMILNNIVSQNHARANAPPHHLNHPSPYLSMNGNGVGATFATHHTGGKRTWDDAFSGLDTTTLIAAKRIWHHSPMGSANLGFNNGFPYGYPKSPNDL